MDFKTRLWSGLESPSKGMHPILKHQAIEHEIVPRRIMVRPVIVYALTSIRIMVQRRQEFRQKKEYDSVRNNQPTEGKKMHDYFIIHNKLPEPEEELNSIRTMSSTEQDFELLFLAYEHIEKSPVCKAVRALVQHRKENTSVHDISGLNGADHQCQ